MASRHACSAAGSLWEGLDAAQPVGEPLSGGAGANEKVTPDARVSLIK
jgi:hypothetical protein